jgi:phage/plasmid-associated DNA primase
MSEKDANGQFVRTPAEAFRPHQFEDYITLSCGYDFNANLPEDAETEQEIDTLFETMMPKPDHRKLLMQILASCLDGKQYQQFFMLNGGGGNGKGTTFDLMQVILGNDFFLKANNDLLQSLGKANSASEDMIAMKNKRMLVFEEIGDSINNTIVNRLTGGGTVSGRRLYGSSEVFELMSTTCAAFNGKAKLQKKPDGNSELRRYVDIMFTVNFTTREDKIGLHDVQYGEEILWARADAKYESKSWRSKAAPYILRRLLNEHRQCCDGDKGVQFQIPEEVYRRSEKFLDDQNLFNRLFGELFTPKEGGKLKVKDIWEAIGEHEEYRMLKYDDKRKYNRKMLGEWLQNKFRDNFVTDSSNTQMLKGYELKVEVCSEEPPTDPL